MSRTEYFRAYREKNREKLRKQKREWAAKQRGKQKKLNITVKKGENSAIIKIKIK